MTLAQQIITVGMCVLATLLTRFLPFAVFNARKPTPQYIHYLGELLPGAIFAMLVIYCLRNVSLLSGSHGLPELIGIAVTVGLHLWKRRCYFPSRAGRYAICCWCSLSFNREPNRSPGRENLSGLCFYSRPGNESGSMNLPSFLAAKCR